MLGTWRSSDHVQNECEHGDKTLAGLKYKVTQTSVRSCDEGRTKEI